jgi:hypothetical protein
MYAVTAGSENSVNSAYTSETATSRSVATSPRNGGTRSLHRSGITCRILTDGRDFSHVALNPSSEPAGFQRAMSGSNPVSAGNIV